MLWSVALGGVASVAAAVGVRTVATSSPVYRFPWNAPGCPCSEVLRVGTAAEAGFVPHALGRVSGPISRMLVQRAAPGAVVLVARRGVIAYWKAFGYASIYTNGNYATTGHPAPTPWTVHHWDPMRRDEIFDLASATKMFTAAAIMQLWDEGKIKLSAPVARYLPDFAKNGKTEVTVAELLDHTSGFPPDPLTPLYDVPGTRADRLKHVLELPLAYPPGMRYVYSDINYMTLGALIEHISGEREDVYIKQHIAVPLHLKSLMYNPPAALRPRIAASEYQPWNHRGMLRGSVEDGNAWALGGISGHAGLFSDARDLAVFGQMLLNGGTYDGVRILSHRAVQRMLQDHDSGVPDTGRFVYHSNGYGLWLNRPDLMGALSGPHTAGHEGYTGTMLAVNPKNDIVVVILTNRVHPTRSGPSVVPSIRHVFTDVAKAIPVAIPGDGKAWFAGYGSMLNRTLSEKLPAGDATQLSFATWYRIQHGWDYGVVETSTDATRWTPVKLLTGNSDGWQTVQVALPKGTRYVQFRYRTDHLINGRGWYVRDIQAIVNGKAATPKVLHNEWVSAGH